MYDHMCLTCNGDFDMTPIGRLNADPPTCLSASKQARLKFIFLFISFLLATMSLSQEGPNPLRPYYIPPSVGHASDATHNATSTANFSSRGSPTSTNSFGSSARNILADMDYSEYMSESSPSPTVLMKRLVEQALWKYTSVFLAQPFEVSKTILQVQVARQKQAARIEDDMRRRPGNYRRDSYEVRALQIRYQG